MGKYINRTDEGDLLPVRKAEQLIKAGARLIFDTPQKWEEGLICVVENGLFDAAAYVQDARDLRDFSDTSQDERPRLWLSWNRAQDFAR